MSGEAYSPPVYPFVQNHLVLPAGSHTEGHRTNGKRFTEIMHQGYDWIRKQLPTPGAMNYAFETLALAESTAIGPGIAQRQFWQTVQTPLFVGEMTRPQSGYGGVVQGQAIYQPLFDPYNNTFGAIQG